MLMSVITVVVGVGLILLRRPFSQYALRQQNRVWGVRFGDNARRSAEVVALVVGIGFVTICRSPRTRITCVEAATSFELTHFPWSVTHESLCRGAALRGG